jgi:hypothetical protein
MGHQNAWLVVCLDRMEDDDEYIGPGLIDSSPKMATIHCKLLYTACVWKDEGSCIWEECSRGSVL